MNSSKSTPFAIPAYSIVYYISVLCVLSAYMYTLERVPYPCLFNCLSVVVTFVYEVDEKLVEGIILLCFIEGYGKMSKLLSIS